MTPESSPPRRFAFPTDWRVWLARIEQWPAWRLFLTALLLGLLVSLPWQCAKHFGAKTPAAPLTAAEGDASVTAQAPAARTGRAASILGMPAPSATPAVDQPANEAPIADIVGALPIPEGTDGTLSPASTHEASAAIAVYSPSPRYPGAALRAGEEGIVMVRVNIDSSGMPTGVEIEKSSQSRALDRAALDALRQWRFKPAFAQGAAVESSLVIPINFKSGNDN